MMKADERSTVERFTVDDQRFAVRGMRHGAWGMGHGK